MPAVNPLRGEATLEAGARGTLKLTFDVNSFCYAEERLGKTTDEILEQVTTEFASWSDDAQKRGERPRVPAALLRTLLWAGLQKHQPGTHLAEAGEIMSDAGVSPTVSAVLAGFYAAFGEAEDEQGSHPQSPAAGETGTG